MESIAISGITDSIVLSDDVWSCFDDIYDLSRSHLAQLLSTPPLSTTLRVNSASIAQSEQILRNHLDSLPNGDLFSIHRHPLLNDLLIVSSTRVRRNKERHGEQDCKEVMVDAICGAAILRGSDLFAPGILAANPTIKAGDSVLVYADLHGTCKRGQVTEFLGRKMFVGSGQALFDRHEMFRSNVKLSGVAVTITCPRYSLPSFTNLDKSRFYPQNFPSIVVAHLLHPAMNAVVLDMCAAPGGKACHVASMIANSGSLICIDKSQGKVAKIISNAEMMGLTNVNAFAYNSTKLCSEEASESSEPIGCPPYPSNTFSYILLDPPCSGLGQRPQLANQMTAKDLASYPIVQRKLFAQAVKLLRPGGRLVYSTCTLRPQENEQQVAWALALFPRIRLVESSPRFGECGMRVDGLKEEECAKVQRFDAYYRQDVDADVDMVTRAERDTIGFFIAVFEKDEI